jgi:hypothetical protein
MDDSDDYYNGSDDMDESYDGSGSDAYMHEDDSDGGDSTYGDMEDAEPTSRRVGMLSCHASPERRIVRRFAMG